MSMRSLNFPMTYKRRQAGKAGGDHCPARAGEPTRGILMFDGRRDPGRTRSWRTKGKQARGRRRHADRHVPTAAPVVAQGPPCASDDDIARPRDPAKRRLVRGSRRTGATIGRSELAAESNADRLMRTDHLYDFIVEIDHNTRPRIAGRGSAVFLHLARPGFAPTAGLHRDDARFDAAPAGAAWPANADCRRRDPE